MDLRFFLLCFADIAMVVAGLVYGVKFLKKRNYLLGLEWLIMATSGSNFLVYFFTNSPTVYSISYFFDAFSRAFGFPVIAVMGLMAVTNNYKPSALLDVAVFAASIIGSIILVAVGFIVPAKPYIYIVAFTGYAVFLAYFAKKLMDAGQVLHALLTILVLLSSLTIAYMDDFYKIPGEETNVVLNFYFLALLTWAYMLVELYYAYRALERAKTSTV
jgi:hypothetical protein